jgi:hypothetical protein
MTELEDVKQAASAQIDEEALRASIKASVTKEQDEKVAAVTGSLKRMIQSVANAPVQVSLSDDAKKDIIRDLENRVAKLEKR